jgi:tetratricopeptide (TPR) repeat protein
MRRLSCFGALLAASALYLAALQASSAEDDPAWQACAGANSAPDQRVTACSSVIDAKTETGRRLAAAYCIRGEGLTEKRDLDRALADLNEAIRIDPDYACAYSNRGRVYAAKGDRDHAIADYDQAIRIDPSFALAFNNRGSAFLGTGDAVRAMADFNAAIKLDPKLAIAYGNRGFLYYRGHDFAHAIADYTTQIGLKPDVLGYIDRGNAYRDSEQLNRAAADYGEVIKLAPTDARGWRNRGLIRFFQGNNKGGVADYDKALQYDPADVDSWNNRAQGKLRLGDKAGAIADLRKALELGPDLDTARKSLRDLGVKS